MLVVGHVGLVAPRVCSRGGVLRVRAVPVVIVPVVAGSRVRHARGGARCGCGHWLVGGLLRLLGGSLAPSPNHLWFGAIFGCRRWGQVYLGG